MQGVEGTGSTLERNRRWREKHPGAQAEATNKWRKRQGPGYVGPARQALQEWISEFKESTPCKDCRRVFPACCMDFDHVSGVKIAGISAMVSRCRPREEITIEIAKCELVCANCHRIRGRNRFYTLEKDEAPKGANR